jgi:hypothetical protein
VHGNPARLQGWMSETGEKLTKAKTPGEWLCSSTGARYKEAKDGLERGL